MTRAKLASWCKGFRDKRLHNWMVFAHTPDWQVLGVKCNRCGIHTSCTEKDLGEWQVAWHERWSQAVWSRPDSPRPS